MIAEQKQKPSHEQHSHKPCDETRSCGAIEVERNRYFTGKFMTARDFSLDQDYLLSRHRLHNRVLHGWGIVCGLRVLRHNRPECRERWVIVGPGIAIDCCGREIVLRKETAVKVWDPPEARPRYPKPHQEEEAEDAAAEYQQHPQECPEQGPPLLLCVRYVEIEIEHLPVLHAESQCDPTRREANRVREVAELVVVPFDEVDPGCWKVPDGSPEHRCRDDCDDDLPGPAGICLDPECPCGERVPLALLRPRRLPEGGYTIGEDEIGLLGRRHLPISGEFLTHVSGFNWHHGGTISLSQLRDDKYGRLEVYFDRRLLPSPGDGLGVNAYTFIVQYGGIQQQIEFLPYELENPPKLADNGCTAVFTIDKDLLSPKGRVSLMNNVVYVTLKCDFILDCHGTPVDGNHLRGRLPSGNGVAGGIFESWFRVVPEGEAKEAK